MAATNANMIEMGFTNVPQAMLVKMLTDTYTHPLQAAVRETISNALDANRRAGRGFEGMSVEVVRDPFGDETSIEIRDAGDGMSYERLVNNFLSYADSTKRGDSETIGAFGLGAKSPLAYTSSFEIWTRDASGETLYANPHRTEDGGAEVEAPSAVDDSDRGLISGETGTTVRFPVRAGDEDDALRIVELAAAILRDYAGARGICKTVPATRAFDEGGIHAIRTIGTIACGDHEISLHFNARGKYEYGSSREECAAIAGAIAGDARAIDRYNSAFRVGCWLYPLNGDAWNARGAQHYPFIIDVPSSMLSFVPSRDQAIEDAEAFAKILDKANELFADAVKDIDTMTWMLSHAAQQPQNSYYPFAALDGIVAQLSFNETEPVGIAFDENGVCTVATHGNRFSFRLEEIRFRYTNKKPEGTALGALIGTPDCTAAVFSGKSRKRGWLVADADPRYAALSCCRFGIADGDGKRVSRPGLSEGSADLADYESGKRGFIPPMHSGPVAKSMTLEYERKTAPSIPTGIAAMIATGFDYSLKQSAQKWKSTGGFQSVRGVKATFFDRGDLDGKQASAACRRISEDFSATNGYLVVFACKGLDEDAQSAGVAAFGDAGFEPFADGQSIYKSERLAKQTAAKQDKAASAAAKSAEQVRKMMYKASLRHLRMDDYGNRVVKHGRDWHDYDAYSAVSEQEHGKTAIVVIDTASPRDAGYDLDRFLEALAVARMLPESIDNVIGTCARYASEARLEEAKKQGYKVMWTHSGDVMDELDGKVSVSYDNGGKMKIELDACEPEWFDDDKRASIKRVACRTVGELYGALRNNAGAVELGFKECASIMSFGMFVPDFADDVDDAMKNNPRKAADGDPAKVFGGPSDFGYVTFKRGSGAFDEYAASLLEQCELFADIATCWAATFDEYGIDTGGALASRYYASRRYGANSGEESANKTRAMMAKHAELASMLGIEELVKSVVDGISVNDLVPLPDGSSIRYSVKRCIDDLRKGIARYR